MEILTGIYFFYMFISVYFLTLTIILYFQNKHRLFSHPPITKEYSLTVIIPAWNEQDSIKATIEHVFSTDYNGLKRVIVVNDGSTDNTLKLAQSLTKKYKNLLVLDKKNSGKADSVNYAIKFANTDLVSVIDADSFPEKSAFSKMIGYFDDLEVGAVTATCTPKNRKTFLEKMQTIEYKVIAFTRKLLEYIESIYVAPGSLSIYRRKALKEIGGFDRKNITEDIESTWHILSVGWKVRMSLSAHVYTRVPHTIKAWFRQRTRWALGGLQVLDKYKKFIFRNGIFGYFVVPFFAFGFILGLVGIGLALYMILKRVIFQYLFLDLGIGTGVDFFRTQDLLFAPSILNYFGIVLFILFFFFTIFVLAIMEDQMMEKQSFFNLLFYMTVYLLVYPIVTISSIYRWIKRDHKWR